MTPRYLIAAVVLAAGCEQWKAPKRIHDLEGRVDELAREVATLKGGSAEAKPRAGEPPPEHEVAHAAPIEPAAGEARPPETKDDKDDKAKDDKARSDKSDKEDPMARLRDLVEKNTVAGKRPEPAGKPEGPHWSYEGKAGPPTWGTLDPAWAACNNGKAQSPIDIEPKAGSATPIVFHYKPTAATIVDNGHTLQVKLAAGSSIEIDGRSYNLVQFHFHAPSEHTIAGEHYPLEVHLVHMDSDAKLAVIGVLYDTGADSKVLGGLWSAWPRKVGVEDKLKKPFDPTWLLPDTRTVFRYSGSLTTPPCTEGVLWNVMRRTPSDGPLHLAVFGQHYPRNAREVQPLNDRKIE